MAVLRIGGCIDNGGRIDILVIVAALKMVAVLRIGGCIENLWLY